MRSPRSTGDVNWRAPCCGAVWLGVDAIVVPSLPTIPTLDDGRRRSDRGQRPARPVLDLRQPARPVRRRRSRRAAAVRDSGRVHVDRPGAVRPVPPVARRRVPADGRPTARCARG